MKVPEPDEERPLSWMAILADTPVRSSDGEEVGTIHEVLGSETQDIFHGVVVRTGPMADEVMIPADQVTQITNRAVTVGLSAEEIRALPPYRIEESYQLGFVGFLRKHVGWVKEEDDAP